MKEKIRKALNKQMNAEVYSAYLYLSMSAYFEKINLKGFAHWMRVQAKEEEGHVMRFYTYLAERGGRISFSSIEKPQETWKSPLAVFEDKEVS